MTLFQTFSSYLENNIADMTPIESRCTKLELHATVVRLAHNPAESKKVLTSLEAACGGAAPRNFARWDRFF